MPDGASALYGTDAVAGVTNFILRWNFSGAEVSANLSATTQGGGAQQTYSLLGGQSGDKGYLLVNLEYSKQDAIYGADRDFASNVPSGTTMISSAL